MGNSNTTTNQQSQQQQQTEDNLSNVSLNGSNCKEKLNTSWKFSTIKDDEEKDKSNKLLIDDEDDDDDDEDVYNSTCEDDDNFKKVADKLKLNSILHIDDNHDDVVGENNRNLNLSSTSTTTTATTESSQSVSPKSVNNENNGLNPNDTIENLALNLLNKLKFDNPASPSTITEITLTTVTSTTVTSKLKLPFSNEPAPPPSTPVSSVQETVCLNEKLENLLCDKTKPQLIIDDVLLMSQEDGHPLVPLAEAEQSFNSIEQVKLGDESNVVDELKSETILTKSIDEIKKVEEITVEVDVNVEQNEIVVGESDFDKISTVDLKGKLVSEKTISTEAVNETKNLKEIEVKEDNKSEQTTAAMIDVGGECSVDLKDELKREIVTEPVHETRKVEEIKFKEDDNDEQTTVIETISMEPVKVTVNDGNESEERSVVDCEDNVVETPAVELKDGLKSKIISTTFVDDITKIEEIKVEKDNNNEQLTVAMTEIVSGESNIDETQIVESKESKTDVVSTKPIELTTQTEDNNINKADTISITEPIANVQSTQESNDSQVISNPKSEPESEEIIIKNIKEKVIQIDIVNQETTFDKKSESSENKIEKKPVEIVDASENRDIKTGGNPNDEEIINKGEEKTAFMMLINKIAPHSNLINHHFEFEIPNNESEHIHSVSVTGNFNNWQQFLSMNKIDSNDTTTKWCKDLMLAPGSYEYKFVINNTDWRCNSNLPTNGLNNILNLAK